MTKLKLEDLEVTSFATTSDAAGRRGTVLGAQQSTRPGCEKPFGTYDIVECGDTQYMDCTFGCSINTNCPGGCIEP